jgi:hypothetical protein
MVRQYVSDVTPEVSRRTKSPVEVADLAIPTHTEARWTPVIALCQPFILYDDARLLPDAKVIALNADGLRCPILLAR